LTAAVMFLFEDFAGFSEVAAHRLLDQRRRAVRQRLEHAGMAGRRRGEIEDRILHRRRFVNGAEGRNAPFRRQSVRLGLIGIEKPGDREAGFPVGRKVRVVDDRPRSENHDRPGF
jgi:hypothetical protein